MPQPSRGRSDMDFSSLQGWSGAWFTFASVQTTMWIGLVRGRAGIGKYLISPLVAAPLTAAAAFGIGLLISCFDEMNVHRCVVSGRQIGEHLEGLVRAPVKICRR